MGISSKKKKTTVKPVYEREIRGASNALTSAFSQNQPAVQGIANDLRRMLPEMQQRWREGNPALNAAQEYVTTTLGGDATNPYLDQYIAQAQNEAENTIGARLNKLGIGPAGSTYQGNIAREVGKVGLGMRYNDWLQAQQRKAQAAGMAPGIAAGEVVTVAPMLATAELGANLPLDSASRFAVGQGALLGPYTNTTQRTSGGLVGSLLGAALSGWASGGFRG